MLLTICAILWFTSILSLFYLLPRFGFLAHKYMLLGDEKCLQLKEEYELDIIVVSHILLATSAPTLNVALLLCDIAMIFITLAFLADNHYQDWALQRKGFPLHLSPLIIEDLKI